METLDLLKPGGFKFLQAKNGYRYSLDPVLLTGFVGAVGGQAVLDLGTGAGVIPLLLSRSEGAGRIVGLELQSGLAERARRNVRLNNLDGQIQIIEGDLRNIRDLFSAASFGLVVANPPYRKPGSGRVAPEDERAAARHELAGGLEDFLSAASYLLINGGRFVVVYLAERLAELLERMRSVRLEPKRLRCVHSRPGEEARIVLVEGRKCGGPGLTVESPLYVYRGSGREYTEDILKLYGK
ncbi:MAG: tRNA1(Val) (adenine(37)-N6)-methyltransferase [Desulfuromonadales bacterium]|nr:tRNA1(Val) (adenine(37)-N6)-methyltransferase [Desulfuromonadales bacterium]